MKKILFILIAPIILGIIFQTHYDIEPAYQEFKIEYETYVRERAAYIRELWFNSLSCWEAFKEEAKEIAKKYDIPLSVMLGQAALESGRCTSYRARHHNNFFGLAAYNDDAPGLRFEKPVDSIIYYANLIAKTKRYQKAYTVRDNPYKMIFEIKKAGYATDENYVNKVTKMREFQEFINY
jgi:flagellum-specific peptidoglycan hydrolase FlgJ